MAHGRSHAVLAALVALLALAGPATAAYDAGSALTAEAPVSLTGRADTLVRDGVIGFVNPQKSGSPALTLAAAEARVAFRELDTRCAGGDLGSLPQCAQSDGRAADDLELTGATITLTGVTGPSKVILSNDPEQGPTPAFAFGRGAILVTTGGTTRLGANPEGVALSVYQDDWSTSEGRSYESGDPLYVIDAATPRVESTGAGEPLVQASGNFQTILQGFKVKVTGTGADGKAVERTFETAYPEGGSGVVSYVRVDASEGSLRATLPAQATLYGVEAVDVAQNGKATFPAAEGRVIIEGVSTDYAGEDVTLTGPLAIKEIAAQDGSAIRLSMALSSDLFLKDELTKDPEDAQDTATLVAAGVAGAGGATALAALLYFWPRAKYAATLLVLPLYSRIERTQVLDHEKRDEIYELIRQTPGIHAHEIGEKTQIGWGTTVYHLKMLESHSLVVSKKSGRYKRFYVNTGEFTKKKDVYAALRNETAKAVAQYIVEHPGTSQKDLCAALNLQPSLVSWHVEKLEGVDLVKRVKDGRMVRYFAGPAWADLNVRIVPGGGAEGVAET